MNYWNTEHALIQVVAMSPRGIIGIDGELPFRLKGDLKRFKEMTMGHPMIMGRKTFESLPGLLPGRIHVVLTRQPEVLYNGVCTRLDADNEVSFEEGHLFFAMSMQHALDILTGWAFEKVFIIGGGELYRQTLPYVDEVRATHAHEDPNFEEDSEVTTYPLSELEQWEASGKIEVPAGTHHYVNYSRKS